MWTSSLSIAGRREAGSQSQLTNEGRVTCQSIAGQPFAGNLLGIWSNHVTKSACLSGVEGNRSTMRKPMYINSTQKGTLGEFLGSNPGSSCCEATIVSVQSHHPVIDFFFSISGHDDTASWSRPAISYRSAFQLSRPIFLNSVPSFM